MFRKAILMITVTFMTSSCEKSDDEEIGDYMHVQSGGTHLQIPRSFYRESTVPWTPFKYKPCIRASSLSLTCSLILNRRPRDIEGLKTPLKGDIAAFVFLLIAVDQVERDKTDIEHAVKPLLAINKATNVIPDEETRLFRAYDELNFDWMLIDKEPPVEEKNIVASCREDQNGDSRCSFSDFYPIKNIAVSMSLSSPYLSQYQLIKNDVTNLVKSWEIKEQ